MTAEEVALATRFLDVVMAPVTAKLDAIAAKVDLLISKETLMAPALEVLTEQVRENTNAEQSAVTLIQGLARQIEQSKSDPVALQALSDQLKSSAARLFDAITANTATEPVSRCWGAPSIEPPNVPPLAS